MSDKHDLREMDIIARLDANGTDMIRYGPWQTKLFRDAANAIRQRDKEIAALKAEVINHKERRLKEGLISAAADMHPYAIEARDIQIAALKELMLEAGGAIEYLCLRYENGIDPDTTPGIVISKISEALKCSKQD